MLFCFVIVVVVVVPYYLLICRLQIIMRENRPSNIAEQICAGRIIQGLCIGISTDHKLAISDPEHVAVAPHKDTAFARTVATTRGAKRPSYCRLFTEDDIKCGAAFSKSMQRAASTTSIAAASLGYQKKRPP